MLSLMLVDIASYWIPWLLLLVAVLPLVAVVTAGLGIAYPNPFRALRKYESPEDYQLEPECLELSGGSAAWYFPHAQASRAVLVCHGRSRCKAHMLPLLSLLAEHWTVLAFDFPGHGENGYGRTTIGWREADTVEEGIKLLANKGHHDVVVFGVSMGGAASLLALARTPQPSVRGLVTDGVFAELKPLLRHATGGHGLAGWLQAPAMALAGLISGYKPGDVQPVTAARKLGVPLIVLHGDQDPLALPVSATAIAQAAGVEPQFYPGGHDEPLNKDMQGLLLTAIRDFPVQ